MGEGKPVYNMWKQVATMMRGVRTPQKQRLGRLFSHFVTCPEVKSISLGAAVLEADKPGSSD